MTILEKLDMLVQYERIDAPKDKKSRFAWQMYMAHKIVDFLGARELTMMLGLTLESLDERHGPSAYSIVATKLIAK